MPFYLYSGKIYALYAAFTISLRYCVVFRYFS